MMLNLNGIKSLHEKMYNTTPFKSLIDNGFIDRGVLHFFEKLYLYKSGGGGIRTPGGLSTHK
jgi:hypothetical protein